jgi:bacterioferritin (cytochrome b1)
MLFLLNVCSYLYIFYFKNSYIKKYCGYYKVLKGGVIMVTLVGMQTEVRKAIYELTELDYDAIEAYKSAIERLENEEYKRKMREFMADHEEHVRSLSNLLRRADEKAPSGPSIKQYLTSGKIVIGSLLGDKSILQAMKTNEDDTNTAYERVLKYDGLAQDERQIIEKGLADERKHRTWIENTLAKL